MRPFDAILFDLGNTLIYFSGNGHQIYSQADRELLRQLKANGLDLEEETFLQAFRSRVDQYSQQRDSEFIEYTSNYILRSLLGELGYVDVPESIIKPALKAMFMVSQAHWIPEEEAIPTLKKLQAFGYRLGLISNASDDEDVQTLIDKAAIRPYFGVILVSAAEGIRKPNPLIFLKALERLEVPPSRAAMIGDTLGADILGAHNAGIYSIWITRRADKAANRDHEDTIQPDAILPSLADLPGLLDELEGVRGKG